MPPLMSPLMSPVLSAFFLSRCRSCRSCRLWPCFFLARWCAGILSIGHIFGRSIGYIGGAMVAMAVPISAQGEAVPGEAVQNGSEAVVIPHVRPLPAAIPTSDTLLLRGVIAQGGLALGVAPTGAIRVELDGGAIPLASDGQFLIGFDRDAGRVARLVVYFADGRVITQKLAVAKGDWLIEHVDVDRKGSAQSSAEFQHRRAGELAQIAAARRGVSNSNGWQQSFIWPVVGRISGRFGAQRLYRGVSGSYHGGVDIAAARGTEFVAPADGVVVLAASSPFMLEGQLLIIDHGMGLNSAFLHCSRLDVDVGAHVRQGQILGAVGASGRASGPHLHWGLKWRAARLDPVLHLIAPSPSQ